MATKKMRKICTTIAISPEVAAREAKDVHSLVVGPRNRCAHMSFFREVQLEDKFGPFAAFQEALDSSRISFKHKPCYLASSRPRRCLKVPCGYGKERSPESRRNESFSALQPTDKTRIACPG